MIKLKKPLPIIVLSLFTFFFIALLFKNKPLSNSPGKHSYTLETNVYSTPMTVGDAQLTVEIVSTSQDITDGLSRREKMCETCGMYFDFGYKDTTPTFWMKDMLFPIDIIWIDDGVVVGIEKNVPAPQPGTPDSELPKYRPSQTIDNVLEVNAGLSDKLGISVGDVVTLTN